MTYDGQSLSEQTPDVSANTSRDLTSLTAAEMKDLTVERLAAWCDITVDKLLKAVSDYAEKTHHAAERALSATFVEQLYKAYAKIPNPIIETPQGNVGSGLQEKSHFLAQYDKWEKKLQGHGSIYLNHNDRLRLYLAFDSIALPGQDWSFEDHKALRDHINTVCPS